MTRIADLVRSSDDIDTETVTIDKWGVTVQMRGMSGILRAQYLQRLIAANDEDDTEALSQLDAELVVACTFDPETDLPAFESADVPMLMTKAGDIIGALSVKAQRLSGLDGKAEERLGKGSSTSAPTDVPAVDTPPSDASSSVSPVS